MSKLKFKVGDRVKVTDDAEALMERCGIIERSGHIGVITKAQHSGKLGYQVMFDCDQEEGITLWISEDLMDHVQFCATYSGISYPMDPKLGDFSLVDIAHSLSLICRFNGHSTHMWSVAQHSLLVIDVLRISSTTRLIDFYGNHLLKWALLHDAPEAYVGDMVRPLKDAMPEYQEAEKRIERAMAEQFQLSLPMPDEVKMADDRALAIEAQYLGFDISGWGLPKPPFGVASIAHHLQDIPPKAAELAWLTTASDLGLPFR